MAINLLSVQPHKVSRDLSGYITYVYGPPKVGKTTFGTKMPGHLILAFEKGYRAIPGAMAQDITSWSEVKQVVRELKKPEVKERFQSIILDTVDIASDLCQKYVCNQLGIDSMGEGGWANNSWVKYKKEFEETFRSLAQMGYAIVFISHAKEKTITPKESAAYQQICSTVQSSAMNIIENMSDIIAYAHVSKNAMGESKPMLTIRSTDDSVRCGCRFKHIVPEIEFTYDALTKALNDAIDKEAEETNGAYITNERGAVGIEEKTYDFDGMMTEFNDIAGKLMTENQSNAAKITAIIDKYLGKGKKIGECTPTQCEQIELILIELRDLVK